MLAPVVEGVSHMKSPFDRGCIARVMGVPMVCCPHPIPTDDAENWRDGWDWAGRVMWRGLPAKPVFGPGRRRSSTRAAAAGPQVV
jgi:hypothetical protein